MFVEIHPKRILGLIWIINLRKAGEKQAENRVILPEICAASFHTTSVDFQPFSVVLAPCRRGISFRNLWATKTTNQL